MTKVPGFAEAFVARWRIVEMDIRLRFSNAAGVLQQPARAKDRSLL